MQKLAGKQVGNVKARPLPSCAEDHKMRSIWMEPHWRRRFCPFSGHLGKLGKEIKDGEQISCIAASALDTPLAAPDFGEIKLRAPLPSRKQ